MGTPREQTMIHYDRVISECRQIFLAKAKDYGISWIIFRLPSLTDQILIKARRIRRLEETGGVSMIPEGVEVEYQGILNYCVMALIKLWYPNKLPQADPILAGEDHQTDMIPLLNTLYGQVVDVTRQLMQRKNHDYGEAWREMRLSSMTDQILVKVMRIKAIEENHGEVKVSEGLDSQYSDILNYCVFSLIRFSEF